MHPNGYVQLTPRWWTSPSSKSPTSAGVNDRMLWWSCRPARSPRPRTTSSRTSVVAIARHKTPREIEIVAADKARLSTEHRRHRQGRHHPRPHFRSGEPRGCPGPRWVGAFPPPNVARPLPLSIPGRKHGVGRARCRTASGTGCSVPRGPRELPRERSAAPCGGAITARLSAGGDDCRCLVGTRYSMRRLLVALTGAAPTGSDGRVPRQLRSGDGTAVLRRVRRRPPRCSVHGRPRGHGRRGQAQQHA